MFGAIWSFLQSPLGITLAASAIHWALHKAFSGGDDRLAEILNVAGQVLASMSQSLPAGKAPEWGTYFGALVSALKAQGLGEPSGVEFARIQALYQGATRSAAK